MQSSGSFFSLCMIKLFENILTHCVWIHFFWICQKYAHHASILIYVILEFFIQIDTSWFTTHCTQPRLKLFILAGNINKCAIAAATVRFVVIGWLYASHKPIRQMQFLYTIVQAIACRVLYSAISRAFNKWKQFKVPFTLYCLIL